MAKATDFTSDNDELELEDKMLRFVCSHTVDSNANWTRSESNWPFRLKAAMQ